jgi:hypothetical protein
MTDTPMKLVVNCETGEQELIPLTAEELAQVETDRLAYEAQEAERLALETAQAEAQASAVSKLEALGLTAEEIAALKS